MTLFKSNIFTGSGYVKYLLLEDSRIIYAGNEKPDVKIDRDWKNRYIYPGFIDAHTHILWHGLNLIRCSLNGVADADEIYSRVKTYADKNPGTGYIIAEGFDETTFRKKGLPLKKHIDGMFPDRPVVLRRICGHAAVINQKAYELLKDDLDIYNSRTGLAKEGNILKLNSIFTPGREELTKAFFAAESDMFSKGITGVGDMCTEDSLEIFTEEKFHIDIAFYYPYKSAARLKQWKNRRNVRANGLKMFTDGSIGSYTAAISKKYSNGGNGDLLLDEQEIIRTRKYADRNGLQLAVHAIGDRAIELALNTLTEGHRIEHFELADRKQIERTAEKGIILSMQPNFIGNWSMKGQMYEQRLPKSMYRFNNVINYINEKGIRLGLGSDCMPVSPVYGIASLASADSEYQRMDAFESVRLYTEGSARICSMSKRGVLSKGYYADFIVTDSDMKGISLEKQPNILYTYKNGKEVYNKEGKW